MERNNGKIAIAIVAMFVVALSVVGFTYAYFTAQVQGNTAEKSVEVQAGIMQIDYQNGQELAAQNVVPGWVSDGKHFYDPVASLYVPATKATDADNDGVKDEGETAITDASGNEVTAIKAVTALDEGVTLNSPTSADGITDPVTFSVKNTGTLDADYVIRLTNITNQVAEDNLLVHLFKGEWTNGSSTVTFDENGVPSVTGAELLNTEVLATTSPQMLSMAVETIAPAKTDPATPAEVDKYFVILQYVNDYYGSQDGSANKNVKATVEVVGVQVNDGKYYTADGTLVTLDTDN